MEESQLEPYLLDMLRISHRGIKLLSSVYHLIWCWTKKVVVREDMYILWLVFHCMYTLKNINKIQDFFRNQGVNHGSPSGISKIHWVARWALGPDKLPFAFLNTLWTSWDLGTDSLQKTLISYVLFLSCDLNTFSIDLI